MRSNQNLTFYNESTYQGLPIQIEHGQVVKDYLDSTFECFQKAIDQYGRVCMMRFDLHVPEDYAAVALRDNHLMSKFLQSLKSQIQWSQNGSKKEGNRVHDTNVRYLWCRETSSTGRIHYHVVLLLNHDAYAFIGGFDLGKDNMYRRIHDAWASALGMYPPDILGLVHIPENPVYQIRRDNAASFNSAFHRASYLCKVESKEYGQGFHSFGSSRI